MFFFSDFDNSNFASLCQLCEEYQTIWLATKISKALEKFEVPSSTEKVVKLLELVSISKKMNWKNATRKLLNQLSESFIILQTFPEFSELDVDIKVIIARQRLWKFALTKDQEFDGFDIEMIKWIINTKEAGLLSIFQEGDQEIFDEEALLVCAE